MVTKAEILNNIPCLVEANAKHEALIIKQEEERKKEEEKLERVREKEYKASLKRIIKAYKSINIKKAFKKEVTTVQEYSYTNLNSGYINVVSSLGNSESRGIKITMGVGNNIIFNMVLYDHNCPPGISENETEEFNDEPFWNYYEVLLKKFFNITPEECYQGNGYDKILVTLSKVLSKKVVKEVKEQIENMLSDNITDIICTIQENSQ